LTILETLKPALDFKKIKVLRRLFFRISNYPTRQNPPCDSKDFIFVRFNIFDKQTPNNPKSILLILHKCYFKFEAILPTHNKICATKYLVLNFNILGH